MVILLLGVVSGGGWYVHTHRDGLLQFVRKHAAWMPGSLPSFMSGKGGIDGSGASPMTGFRAPPEALDATLQQTPLWRVLKRDFPDWYAARLTEIAALAAENKDDFAIGQQMVTALVTLRRQQAKHALSASLPVLKTMASSFHDNLVQLRKHSVEACHEFISKGEASPLIVSLMQNPAYSPSLQAVLTSVFEAISEGRKAARVYPQPRQVDYDALMTALANRGWSKADIQDFNDPQLLARSPPERLCQMVQDWFAAQLAIKDPDSQFRLLVDSLKPLVAG
jgi:hypothetical protein